MKKDVLALVNFDHRAETRSNRRGLSSVSAKDFLTVITQSKKNEVFFICMTVVWLITINMLAVTNIFSVAIA